MNQYEVLKGCWLGKKGDIIGLNDRQAANPVAGGFIKKAADKKPAAKTGGGDK